MTQLRLHRLWRGAGFALLAAVILLSLIPPAPVTIEFALADKLQHLVAYFVLMNWFSQLQDGRPDRMRLAAAFILLGVVLEWLQGLTSYREASIADAVANAGGVALGWLAAPPRLPNFLLWIEGRQ